MRSLVHAAPRTEIKELQQARALLLEKYGKEFAQAAIENTDGKVAPRVLERLKVEPPSPELVQRYLEEIARTYSVDWPKGRKAAEEAPADDDDDQPGDGEKEPAEAEKRPLEAPLTTEELSRATPPRDVGGPKSPVHVAPPKPSTDNVSPRVKLPDPPELKPGSKLAGTAKRGAMAGSATSTGKGPSTSSDKDAVGGKIPDVDELARRFAALKK